MTAKGRLWANADKLRLELQASGEDGGGGDVQVLVDGEKLTVIERARTPSTAGRCRRATQKIATEAGPRSHGVQGAITG